MEETPGLEQLIEVLLKFKQTPSDLSRKERTIARQLWLIIDDIKNTSPRLCDNPKAGSPGYQDELKASLLSLLKENTSVRALYSELGVEDSIRNIKTDKLGANPNSLFYNRAGATVFNIGRDLNIAGDLNHLEAKASSSEMGNNAMTTNNDKKWDVFISYASEDREVVASPLAEALRSNGLSVWFDQFELKPGKLLLQSINEGLRSSEHGIVILSPFFFGKQWTQQELGGLFQRMTGEINTSFLIPIWYQLDVSDIRRFSPILSNLIAIPWSIGLNQVVQKILAVIRPIHGDTGNSYATTFSLVFSALSEDDFKYQINRIKDKEHVLEVLRAILFKVDYPQNIRARTLEALIALNALDHSTTEKLITRPDSGWMGRVMSILSQAQYDLSEQEISLLLENTHLPKTTNGLGDLISEIVKRNHFTSRVFLPASNYPHWQVKYDCVRCIIKLDDQDSLETLRSFSRMKYWQARRHIIDYILSRLESNRLSSNDRKTVISILEQIITDGKADPSTPTLRRAQEALAKARGVEFDNRDLPQEGKSTPNQSAKYIIYAENINGLVIGDHNSVNQEFSNKGKGSEDEEPSDRQ